MIKNEFLAKIEYKSDIMCSLRSLFTESTIVKGLIFIFLLLFFINIGKFSMKNLMSHERLISSFILFSFQ